MATTTVFFTRFLQRSVCFFEFRSAAESKGKKLQVLYRGPAAISKAFAELEQRVKEGNKLSLDELDSIMPFTWTMTQAQKNALRGWSQSAYKDIGLDIAFVNTGAKRKTAPSKASASGASSSKASASSGPSVMSFFG